jgi:hypothetical protein
MSTNKDALRARMARGSANRDEGTKPPLTAVQNTAPARVTLNLPPRLFRELSRWADDAAADLDVPRVGIQDAVRAMIAVTLADKGVTAEVREHIRQARG